MATGDTIGLAAGHVKSAARPTTGVLRHWTIGGARNYDIFLLPCARRRLFHLSLHSKLPTCLVHVVTRFEGAPLEIASAISTGFRTIELELGQTV